MNCGLFTSVFVSLLEQFDKVTFTHVRREFNQLADGMVNKILDAHASDTNRV